MKDKTKIVVAALFLTFATMLLSRKIMTVGENVRNAIDTADENSHEVAQLKDRLDDLESR